ncbi:proton channel OTOP1-like [Xyrauchen texanus]|uniref:proton channel OTOP1-like n=1 Tax=Xyrauchen texanus TaxID=154827 RepID=UPI002242AA2E|nr:proton channel OTOP1-like [Xyrauchen texanus]
MNKHSPSSSSGSSADSEKKLLSKLKVSLTKKFPQKNAETLSAQYGTNLLLIGVSVMLALAQHGPVVREEHLLTFITVLMLVQLVWMLCYMIRQEREHSPVPERDAHAGTSWIQGGLTMLALLSLIMDAFRIGYFVGYHSCISAVLGVYPIIHALHTISQVHFLWFHIKDVIKKYETFERFGVIHAVFTNLLLWCNGVMSEAEHFLSNHHRRLTELGYNLTTVDAEPQCNCSTSVCSMFSTSLNYLYPFNIEYHIFVSAMLFVMWKNIGRTLDHHTILKRPTTCSSGVLLGPVLGLLALASSITVLVVYLIHVENSVDMRQAAISMFYCYGVVILACMCGASSIGLLIYRMEDWPMDTDQNPSRTLDSQLLLGSSLGSWLMSWCSVVAVASGQSTQSYRWTCLAYSLLLVLEKCFQNLFIMESLYRRRRDLAKSEDASATVPEIFSVAASMVPPYDGIVNRGYETQDKRSLEEGPPEKREVYSRVPLPVGLDVTPSKKEQILKNITIFLFMCNISLWILPAFGCRPQYDNDLEHKTFGFGVWTTVLNVAIPLNLFYRMHSVASLFEVFRKD